MKPAPHVRKDIIPLEKHALNVRLDALNVVLQANAVHVILVTFLEIQTALKHN